MKLNPPLLALLAGGVAAFLLLRPKPAPSAPQRGFLDRVENLGQWFDRKGTLLSDFVTESVDYASRPSLAKVGDVIDPYKLQRGEGDRVTVAPLPPGEYPAGDRPSWLVPGEWPPVFPYGGT